MMLGNRWMTKMQTNGMCRLTVSPNGVAWAPPEARAGVVPRMLQEILKTRIMVKAAMKRHPASAKVRVLPRNPKPSEPHA